MSKPRYEYLWISPSHIYSYLVKGWDPARTSEFTGWEPVTSHKNIVVVFGRILMVREKLKKKRKRDIDANT